MNDRAPDLKLLAAAAPDVRDVDDDAMVRARARLDALIRVERETPHQSSTRKRRWIAPATVAACLAGAVVIAQTFLPSGNGGPVQVAALERLALVAAEGIRPNYGPNDYAYQRSAVTRHLGGGGGVGHWSVIVDDTVETWVAPNGSGRTLTTRSSTRFPTQEDEAAWRQAGSPPISTDSPPDLRFGAGNLGFFGFTEVPNEEGALVAAIQASPDLGEPARPLDLLDAVADLLRRPYAPPEYRATLFRVVAGIEGVLTTSDGTEVLISLAGETHRLDLVFDAETSELLVERTIEIAPDGSEQVFQEIRYLESGIVGSVEDRP